jgi:hypothetical protein
LPQLVYDAVEAHGELEGDSWREPLQNADEVDWKHALRIAALLAVPFGVVANLLSFLGAFLMVLTAVLVVVLYMRNRQPAWITVGAGARIGLVVGVISSWTALATAGISLFAMRFWLHQGQVFDDFWTALAGQQVPARLAESGWDAQMITLQKAKMMTPDGQAGWTIGILLFLAGILLPFAVAGGALGARLVVRLRRSAL